MIPRFLAAIIQERDHGSPEANRAAIAERLREAAARGARLALLMELHNGPYFCQTQSLEAFERAEPIPGPSTDFLGALAAELGLVVVGSLFERRAPGLYHNTAVVLDADGRLAGIYRKMHIPQDPGFEEKFYFTPGDLGFRPIPTAVGKLGVLVCWDQWFPEAARLMAIAGAELLLYPTAIGWDPRDPEDERERQREAWMLVQRGHAVANALPVLVCNRVGLELSSGGGRASASGDRVSRSVRKASGSHAPEKPNPKSFSWRSTRPVPKRCVESGLSSATAGSSATKRFSSAGTRAETAVPAQADGLFWSIEDPSRIATVRSHHPCP